MRVDYLDHMGKDLDIVNAARVSYDKYHEEFTDGDMGLLNFLVKNKHWTPFAHGIIKFRMTTSIAVANQLKRHQVGFALNEVSRRYVDTPPEYDLPKFNEWRGRPGKGQSKQGSTEDAFDETRLAAIEDVANDAIYYADWYYKRLLELGVAPEQARLVLPMAMTTQWVWTGSLYGFVRLCIERLAPDAQKETRDVAKQIYPVLQKLFPHSMTAFNEYHNFEV